MPARNRLSPHVWITSPLFAVVGPLALVHGQVLVGLCFSLAGAGGMLAMFRRNASKPGPLDWVALACFGVSALLLLAIGIWDVAASQP